MKDLSGRDSGSQVSERNKGEEQSKETRDKQTSEEITDEQRSEETRDEQTSEEIKDEQPSEFIDDECSDQAVSVHNENLISDDIESDLCTLWDVSINKVSGEINFFLKPFLIQLVCLLFILDMCFSCYKCVVASL